MKQKTKTMAKNNIQQVGGTHYQENIQPWDKFADFSVNWFQGEILKYVCRFKRKGHPIRDLNKAISVAYKAADRGLRGCKKTNWDDLDFILQYVEDYTLNKPGDLLPMLSQICTLVLKGDYVEVANMVTTLKRTIYGDKEED